LKHLATGLIVINIQENSLRALGKGGTIPAAGLAALSVASIALPIININVMGFGGGLLLASPHLLSGVAYLLPLVFLSGFGVRLTPQLQPRVRLFEIAGLVIVVGIALYAAITLLTGMNEMSDLNQQMTQMLGSAHARQFSSMGGASLASGTFTLVLLLLGSIWQVWSGQRY
jgi:hypothetical protein